MVQTIGESLSSVQRHALFCLTEKLYRCRQTSEFALCVTPRRIKTRLLEIAAASRGRIYVVAEELEHDAEFAIVDELYRRVGLRRTRQIWLAYRANKEEPIGAVIAYRGPLGANFSYLENRCDLLLHPRFQKRKSPKRLPRS